MNKSVTVSQTSIMVLNNTDASGAKSSSSSSLVWHISTQRATKKNPKYQTWLITEETVVHTPSPSFSIHLNGSRLQFQAKVPLKCRVSNLFPHNLVFLNLLWLCLVPAWIHSAGHKRHDTVPRLALERALMSVSSLFKLLLAATLFILSSRIYAVVTSNCEGMKLNFGISIGENCVGTFLTITGPISGWAVPTWWIKKSGHSQLGMLGKGCFSVAGICVVRVHKGKERRAWCCPWVEFLLKYTQKRFPTFLQILTEEKKILLGGKWDLKI